MDEVKSNQNGKNYSKNHYTLVNNIVLKPKKSSNTSSIRMVVVQWKKDGLLCSWTDSKIEYKKSSFWRFGRIVHLFLQRVLNRDCIGMPSSETFRMASPFSLHETKNLTFIFIIRKMFEITWLILFTIPTFRISLWTFSSFKRKKYSPNRKRTTTTPISTDWGHSHRDSFHWLEWILPKTLAVCVRENQCARAMSMCAWITVWFSNESSGNMWVVSKFLCAIHKIINESCMCACVHVCVSHRNVNKIHSVRHSHSRKRKKSSMVPVNTLFFLHTQ